MLPSEPGQSATVLVALAVSGGTPSPMSAGKVSSVPPPAIALIAPAMAEISTTTARRTGETENKSRWVEARDFGKSVTRFPSAFMASDALAQAALQENVAWPTKARRPPAYFRAPS